MGDAIMAFWGAPLHDPDHARHAIAAGFAIQEELQRLRASFNDKGWPQVAMGIGINTGLMAVGNMGSEFRIAYTVVGDAVNTASRLEALTRVYQTPIIVGADTKEAVPEFCYRELDQVQIRGKDRPTRIYEPIGPHGDEISTTLRDELQQHQQALLAYHQQDWVKSLNLFRQLNRLAPDTYLYQLYMDRTSVLLDEQPHDGADGPDGGIDHAPESPAH